MGCVQSIPNSVANEIIESQRTTRYMDDEIEEMERTPPPRRARRRSSVISP